MQQQMYRAAGDPAPAGFTSDPVPQLCCCVGGADVEQRDRPRLAPSVASAMRTRIAEPSANSLGIASNQRRTAGSSNGSGRWLQRTIASSAAAATTKSRCSSLHGASRTWPSLKPPAGRVSTTGIVARRRQPPCRPPSAQRLPNSRPSDRPGPYLRGVRKVRRVSTKTKVPRLEPIAPRVWLLRGGLTRAMNVYLLEDGRRGRRLRLGREGHGERDRGRRRARSAASTASCSATATPTTAARRRRSRRSRPCSATRTRSSRPRGPAGATTGTWRCSRPRSACCTASRTASSGTAAP